MLGQAWRLSSSLTGRLAGWLSVSAKLCTALRLGAVASGSLPLPVNTAAPMHTHPRCLAMWVTTLQVLPAHCRLRNMRNTSAIDLSSLAVQYWFAGPLDGAPLFADFAPQQFFSAQCDWATTGEGLGCVVVCVRVCVCV